MSKVQPIRGAMREPAPEPLPDAMPEVIESAPRAAELFDPADFHEPAIPQDGLDEVAGTLLQQHVDESLRLQMLVYGQRHDVQTGFLNYLAFQESLSAWMRGPGDYEVALVWIEVLNLRREFALWGSRGAEALILRVADALRSAVGPGALVGRYSARCFLVALQAPRFNQMERHRIQAIADALSPMRVLGTRSMVEVAAGVAFWPADTTSPEDLVRFASLAASRAAYVKSPSVLAFRSGMNHHLMRDHQLEVEMHRGLDQNQFRIVYQPKVELSTGRILGAEALIRWNHLEWGAVTPSEFIPIAERSELIQQILEFTLRTALEDARKLTELGTPLPLVAVNISWANMRRDDFIRSLNAIIAENPIGETKLELEVTESVLFDDEALFTTRVRQLKALGIGIAIDDFGTRYTGFNVLKRLPLDSMKIDRCFVTGIHRSREARALCQTIVAMARQLKLRTVAEGVEQMGELQAVAEAGCDAVQGFLIQRPVSVARLAEFIQEWPMRMRSFGLPGAAITPGGGPLR